MYDLDQAFGRKLEKAQGKPGDYIPYFSGDTININAYDHSPYANSDPLWTKFYELYRKELYERYTQLRKSTLTAENISQMFTTWSNAIPQEIRNADYEKWADLKQPYSLYYNWIGEYNNLYIDYMTARLPALDEFYNELGARLSK